MLASKASRAFAWSAYVDPNQPRGRDAGFDRSERRGLVFDLRDG
jgi:hypothetical protein